MEIYIDPEEQIMCPYNNSHFIRRKVMNTHLVKCKKSYPDTKLVECDFNVNHKIPEPELQFHHDRCPDRKKMEIAVYQESKTDLNRFPLLNINVPTEETWDNDNVPTYDPKKHCESKEVILHLDVESAAKRRDFRLEQRKRISQLSSNNDEQKNVAGNAPRPARPTNSASVKRELPETQRRAMEEETPDSIADIVQRIRIGASQSYIPKTKQQPKFTK